MSFFTLDHLEYLGGGATVFAIIAHAVNTFPTPDNKYGTWLLGILQFAVGQRIAGANTLKGQDTISAGVPRASVIE